MRSTPLRLQPTGRSPKRWLLLPTPLAEAPFRRQGDGAEPHERFAGVRHGKRFWRHRKDGRNRGRRRLGSWLVHGGLRLRHRCRKRVGHAGRRDLRYRAIDSLEGANEDGYASSGTLSGIDAIELVVSTSAQSGLGGLGADGQAAGPGMAGDVRQGPGAQP